MLHVAPGVLDGGELLVAQCHVFRAHVRIRRAQQVLAVQLRLGGDGGGVEAQQTAGGDTQVPVRPGLWRSPPAAPLASVGQPAAWRAVNAPHLVALVRAGAHFEKGQLVERPDKPGNDQQAA